MPATYTLISSNVLTSTASTVTFSSIPSTYTDLVLRMSIRDTNTTIIIGGGNVKFNGSSTNIYSVTRLIGDGSAASSTRTSNSASIAFNCAGNNAGMTTNTFSSVEIYIPSYTVSQNKPIGQFNVTENNSTTAGDTEIDSWAQLYRDTNAISSMVITAPATFAIGSSFYLYGISNA